MELWSGQPVLKQSFLFDILGEMSDTEHYSNMSPDPMVRFFCDLTMTLIEQSGLICCCRISLVMRSYLGHLVKTFIHETVAVLRYRYFTSKLFVDI